MNENSEMILFIYQDSKMGNLSMTTLIKNLNNTDNKIKKIVEGGLKGYENFIKDSERLLKKYKVSPQESKKLADMSVILGIKWELLKDNSDSHIAGLLTKGYTMGVVNMKKKLDMYRNDIKNDILVLSKRFLKFQQENIELLKKYL